MKKVVVAIILLSVLGWLFYQNIEYKTIDTDALLKQKATPSFLTNQIKTALQNDDIESAKEYKNLADFLHIKLPEKLIKEIDQKDTITKKISDFSKGFFYGSATNSVQLSGSITSDFTVVGDIRDIKNEGKKYLQNKPYDEFVLGMSVVGVALSASTYLSFGSSSPLKISASMLKTAKKTKSLTKGFTKTLIKQMDKTYDKRLFKQMDFQDINSIKRALKSVDITPLEKTLTKLSKVSQNTSLYDTLYLLKYVENEKDLSKVLKLSQKYKKNTKAVIKVLGKGALKGAKKSLVFTTKLLFISVFIFILSIYIYFKI